MDAVVVGLAAFLAAGVTLFSGFGLGTLLLPVFALFFPVELAVAMTAIVHLFNNVVKLLLLGRHADRYVVLRFGMPAVLSAFAGAYVLADLSGLTPLMRYHLFGHEFVIMPLKVAVGTLLIAFTLLEVFVKEGAFVFDNQYLPIGGILSGFFGGLSGHQGALRSAFLINAGLTKERFLGTGVVIAYLVDVARLAVYGAAFPAIATDRHVGVLLTAVASAFAGTWVGNHLVKKATIRTVQVSVSVMVLGIAVGLVLGMV